MANQLNDPRVQEFGGNGPLQRYAIGRLKVAWSISYDVPANWKLVMENTLECYHCGPMHPELCNLLPTFRTGAVDDSTGARLAEHIEAFSMSGKASRPPLPGLLPEDRRSYYGFFAMPNAFINLLSDHVVIDSLEPRGPAATRVISEWLFDPEVMGEPDFDPLDAVEIMDLVNKQDWVVCELAQQGVTSRVMQRGGNYVPLERHIRGFVDYILEKLDCEA